MTKEVLTERSEIMASFNESEISRLVEEQITSDFTELNGIPIDYFKPLYYKYTATLKDFDMNQDLRNEIVDKFIDISLIFIKQIEKVFNIKVSSEWQIDHRSSIPSLALSLYALFVLELMQNVEDVLENFLMKNVTLLAEMFEEYKNKRDASTILYSKTLSPEKALVISNIYDISTYAIENMTEDEFLENLPEGYVPGVIFSKLYAKGCIVGNFMETLRTMYSDSTYLKTVVCFNIESSYRKPTEASKE